MAICLAAFHFACRVGRCDLEGQLGQIRTAERSLQAEISRARADLVHTSAEVKGALERLATIERELAGKRSGLEALTADIQVLEEERDSVRSTREALEAIWEHYTVPERPQATQTSRKFGPDEDALDLQ